jgi:hypothetical protein
MPLDSTARILAVMLDLVTDEADVYGQGAVAAAANRFRASSRFQLSQAIRTVRHTTSGHLITSPSFRLP